MKLSIIILNYKTRGLLRQCLKGLLQHLPNVEHEILVVDNASHDGTADMIVREFPGVICIETERNLGFGGGMNVGIQKAHGEYILLLNTDIAILDDALSSLIAYLDGHPTVGLIGPRLVNPDGSTQLSCYRFPNFFTALWRRTPFGKLPSIQHQLRSYMMADFDHKSDRPVGWILGACMMVRRKTLDAIGLFDERFFLYVEDTDLCRRCWEAGHEVHYVSSAEIVHYHERLSAGSPGFRAIFAYATRVHISSWIKYFRKYAGRPEPKVPELKT